MRCTNVMHISPFRYGHRSDHIQNHIVNSMKRDCSSISKHGQSRDLPSGHHVRTIRLVYVFMTATRLWHAISIGNIYQNSIRWGSMHGGWTLQIPTIASLRIVTLTKNAAWVAGDLYAMHLP